MDRREFIHNLAVTTAAASYLPPKSIADANRAPGGAELDSGAPADVEGHTLLCTFTRDSAEWKVYEDLRARDGDITFVSSQGRKRLLAKSAEAAFADDAAPHLGLALKDIGTSNADLLAELLLQDGEPDPNRVKAAAPPQGYMQQSGLSAFAQPTATCEPEFRLPWDTFVGTKESNDTMPVFSAGNTRTYHPIQYFPELNDKVVARRFDGLLGGWMPAVRKVMPLSDDTHIEVVVFGDVVDKEPFIVQTWHRTTKIQNGKVIQAAYGYTYPDFPPSRVAPEPEEFYRGLLAFAEYWDALLKDFSPTALPQNDWVDMSKHAFVKELMVRPGGIEPKYGAVDRDYCGSEYDGFQDIFTMAVYANLEWGRLDVARTFIDNYFTNFVDAKGNINMRGPETAQYGLTLSLLARYFKYSRDASLLRKHQSKIEATAAMLIALQDESLRLAHDDPGYGLIHGWSESDSCLWPKPAMWWLPYFGNSAFAARGFKDLAPVWVEIGKSTHAAGMEKTAVAWLRRGTILQDALATRVPKDIRHDMKPAYVGTYAGAPPTFRESLANEHPSPQQWPHRAYTEWLQADMLPPETANLVIDCMRAYGATTIGVVANVERPREDGRDILGFISYGYAQMLLRLDRVDEYLLFLYAHRFHDHTRGSWVAGEVSGIVGERPLFCIPAQQTIPLLVRWMLVLEDSDEEKLYLGKAVPRDWVASGKEIRIDQAATRWGRIDFRMISNSAARTVTANVGLARGAAPKEIQVKFRLPATHTLQSVTVNGHPAVLGGAHQDTAIFSPGADAKLEVVARWA
jgi:hypothetical protein